MQTLLCLHSVPDHTPFSSCFWIPFHSFSDFLGWWPKSRHMRPYESWKISKDPLILKTPLENQTELTRPIREPQLLLHVRVLTIASTRCNLMCPITYPHSSHLTWPFSSILRGWLFLAFFFQLYLSLLSMILLDQVHFSLYFSASSADSLSSVLPRVLPSALFLLHSLPRCDPLLLVRLPATGWTCVSRLSLHLLISSLAQSPTCWMVPHGHPFMSSNENILNETKIPQMKPIACLAPVSWFSLFLCF